MLHGAKKIRGATHFRAGKTRASFSPVTRGTRPALARKLRIVRRTVFGGSFQPMTPSLTAAVLFALSFIAQ